MISFVILDLKLSCHSCLWALCGLVCDQRVALCSWWDVTVWPSCAPSPSPMTPALLSLPWVLAFRGRLDLSSTLSRCCVLVVRFSRQSWFVFQTTVFIWEDDRDNTTNDRNNSPWVPATSYLGFWTGNPFSSGFQLVNRNCYPHVPGDWSLGGIKLLAWAWRLDQWVGSISIRGNMVKQGSHLLV